MALTFVRVINNWWRLINSLRDKCNLVYFTHELNRRSTTHMMINISAITIRIRIMVGLTCGPVGVGSFLTTVKSNNEKNNRWAVRLMKINNSNLPTHSIDPSFLVIGILSNRQMQRPSRHSVSGVNSSHCSLKKQLSFTETAARINLNKWALLWPTYNCSFQWTHHLHNKMMAKFAFPQLLQ